MFDYVRQLPNPFSAKKCLARNSILFCKHGTKYLVFYFYNCPKKKKPMRNQIYACARIVIERSLEVTCHQEKFDMMTERGQVSMAPREG